MDIAERAQSLPTEPGVYLFRGARGKVLYVGKAQNLRVRVRSYLSPGADGRLRIPLLVERSEDVEVLVTPNVKDALLLENELIKRHKPMFNVRLRDDKQYLALRLDSRDTWPRLTQVRRFAQDGAQYFGPYTSSIAMRESISNLRKIFPLRSCSDNVFRDYARRGRPCIEFEMKRCSGPCCGLVDENAYAELVRGTALFLKGQTHDLLKDLTARMDKAAEEERFEDAARLRDRISAVEYTALRQQIIAERPVDRDVFGLARLQGEVEIQVLHVRDGRVIGAADYAFSDVRLDDAELMSSFLGQYYDIREGRQIPAEILCPSDLSDDGALLAMLREASERKVVLRQPQRGALRELLAMAESNAELSLARRLDSRDAIQGTLEEIQEKLGLQVLPRRIECYDVSNLSGTFAVASRVVFEDGRPCKSDYRRYRIREMTAGDDVGCLREVIGRRLAKRNSEPLPDLLMVDGGKGQLGVVTAALADAGLSLECAGIAKERDSESPHARVRRSGGLKAERVYRPGRKDSINLPSNARALLLLQRIRDESHRFAIEFQRSLRRRVGLMSILEEIPGIGPSKRKSLLRELGSLRAVRDASTEALAGVTGVSEADAATIFGFLRAAEAVAVEPEVESDENA